MSEEVPYAKFVARLAASPDNFAKDETPYTLLAQELVKLNDHALPLDHLKRVIAYGDKLRMEQVSDLHSASSLHKGGTYGDLAHGLLGIITESLELIPILLRVLKLQSIDDHNLVEELGDQRFYQQLVMNAIGLTPEWVDTVNRRKLQKRYDGLDFKADKALNRDLDAERKELERKD